MAADILDLFAVLDRNSTPLTDELLAVMEKRAKQRSMSEPPSDDFWSSPSFTKWSGLVQTGKKKASDRRRHEFLEEWHATLQQLRDIGDAVSRPENRPSWIATDAPSGAQADQFLHAHYYQRHLTDGGPSMQISSNVGFAGVRAAPAGWFRGWWA